MSIIEKQNYSYLFNAGMSGSSGANLNFLSDYASIKNGSYKKLLKAYYADSSSQSSSQSVGDKKSTATAKDSAQTLAKIQDAAQAFKEASDKLTATGANSVFNKITVDGTDSNGNAIKEEKYDTDAIYKAVNSYVDAYNNLLKEAGSSGTKNITNRLKAMTGSVKANEKMLGKIGITLNEDKTLSIDETKFKDSNMTTVKSLFNGSGSLAYRTSSQSSMIVNSAKNEAAKANTYGGNGKYSNNYSAGSTLSLFS